MSCRFSFFFNLLVACERSSCVIVQKSYRRPLQTKPRLDPFYTARLVKSITFNYLVLWILLVHLCNYSVTQTSKDFLHNLLFAESHCCVTFLIILIIFECLWALSYVDFGCELLDFHCIPWSLWHVFIYIWSFLSYSISPTIVFCYTGFCDLIDPVQSSAGH